jgi:hypothetical protein
VQFRPARQCHCDDVEVRAVIARYTRQEKAASGSAGSDVNGWTTVGEDQIVRGQQA